MAGKRGAIFVHRQVAFDDRAGVCGPCYWCGIALEWKQAHIDHLNDNKADNLPANLVVSCANCNKLRGMTLSFIGSLLPDRVEQVMAQVNARLIRAVRSEAESKTLPEQGRTT